MDTFEKITSIIISEFVEAISFIILLIIMEAFPSYPGKESIITGVFSLWVLSGVATPFIIWSELLQEVLQGLKGGLPY